MTTPSRLRVSEQLSLPTEETTAQTLVVYGGKGMGKTNFGVVFAEELARTRQRFAVLDPVGNWWGLRHSADGKSPGVEVLILGGTHGDIPIEPTAGAVVADLVADELVNVLVDISRRANGAMWSGGEKFRFVADYAQRLFQRQGETMRPLMQILDEAGRFVPQQIPHGAVDIARCVGAIEQLVEVGRNVGVGTTLITQRSARMNKSVSELAECMVAFRTVGPRSIDAILDWFGEHVPKERWKELIEQLRKLPRGEALVVSPGWLEFEGVAKIRARTTLDTSATPTSAGRPEPKHGAKPDLAKYLARMAATIEKAKSEDPRHLRSQVADLQKQLRDLQATTDRARDKGPARASRIKRVEVPVLKDAHVARLEKVQGHFFEIVNRADLLVDKVAGLREEAKAVMTEISGALRARLAPSPLPSMPMPAPVVTVGARELARIYPPAPRPRKQAGAAEPTDELTGTQQRIVDVTHDLVRRGITPTRDAIARWLGIHPNGGRYGSDLAALRANGLLDGYIPTQRGVTLAMQPGPRGLEGAIEVLYGTQRRILEVLIASRQPLTRETLAELLGIHPNGGRYGSDLARLRTMGIITERGPIAPTEALYR